MTPIELLSPAKDLETGMAAINCGADAIYIGAARFGARQSAGNPLTDIEKLAAYAHRYWARVYVTLNTLLHDHELPEAVRLAHQLHSAGVDALIIQDVGLLSADLPPLPLIASTQMHNHTAERVAFLEKVGFQRVILARELSLEQIGAIRAQTSIELETFVHGALCVSYSGQCYLSYALGGRSGNRGECAQPCRRPYTLQAAEGQVAAAPRHWLSLHDLNLTAHLADLLQAGVSSFKIEGRLKDKAYVMNVVGHYRRQLDALLPELGLVRSSSGSSQLDFTPDPAKTFNRGYTTYFLPGRGASLACLDTPKFVGEPVGQAAAVGKYSFALLGEVALHAGDGLCFFDRQQELQGTVVNRVEGQLVFPARLEGIEPGTRLYRNHDHDFIARLGKSRPARKIELSLKFSETPAGFCLAMTDSDGVSASFVQESQRVPAEKPGPARARLEKQLTSLGETEFVCSRLELDIAPMVFLPFSELNALRRGAVEALRAARLRQRPVQTGGTIADDAPYPERQLTYLGNVLNRQAEAFYRRHGVTQIEPAAESGLDLHGRKVMTTKYCLKHQLGYCPRAAPPSGPVKLPWQEPLFLVDDEGRRLRLKFNCAACEMEVYLV